VSFNGFFEAESFSAILITHGTHGHSQEFFSGALVIDARRRGTGAVADYDISGLRQR